jgi:hypothetical protein
LGITHEEALGRKARIAVCLIALAPLVAGIAITTFSRMRLAAP